MTEQRSQVRVLYYPPIILMEDVVEAEEAIIFGASTPQRGGRVHVWGRARGAEVQILSLLVF